jgi:GrpB-like predicted nucleotidyltransferase (UPF0157 family)
MTHADESDVLGLEQGLVRLHAPTPLWADLYQQEAKRIRTALAPQLLGLEHIGSTAIPGIKAKPILDMMAGLPRLEDALLCRELLETLGYVHAVQIVIERDVVFTRGTAWTHLLHVVEYGSRQWFCNLRFRDRLRNEPGLAEEYEHLKVCLSEEFKHNRPGYTKAKAAFIQSIVD